MKGLQHLLRPLANRIANMLARGVVALVDDSKKLQALQLQLLTDEVRDDVERMQQYGFTSVPLADAEALVLCLGGRRDHLVAVAVEDRRYRKKNMAAGEVALYTDQGASVYLKRNRTVVTDSEIRLGSDSASEYVALASLVLARLNQIKAAFDGHTHGPGTYATAAGGGPVAGLSAGAGAMGSISAVAATKVKAE